jgi:hypothetical protein
MDAGADEIDWGRDAFPAIIQGMFDHSKWA